MLGSAPYSVVEGVKGQVPIHDLIASLLDMPSLNGFVLPRIKDATLGYDHDGAPRIS